MSQNNAGKEVSDVSSSMYRLCWRIRSNESRNSTEHTRFSRVASIEEMRVISTRIQYEISHVRLILKNHKINLRSKATRWNAEIVLMGTTTTSLIVWTSGKIRILNGNFFSYWKPPRRKVNLCEKCENGQDDAWELEIVIIRISHRTTCTHTNGSNCPL